MHMSENYQLEDPLTCLKTDLPPKSQFKENMKTKILASFDNELRVASNKSNSKMNLNMSWTQSH